MKNPDARARVLIVSYACDPYSSMESRLGWNRAIAAAQVYETTVICDSMHRERNARYFRQHDEIPFLSFEYVNLSKWQKPWMERQWLKYLAYHWWHQRAYQQALAMHQERPWDLVHQVGFCGYREPGYCWKIDAPFVWGPVGGTSDVPLVFLPSLGASGAMSELLRQFPNFVHLRFRRRVRQALRSARHVLAANSSGKRHIEAVHGRPVEKLLETGITSLPPRHDRGGREGPIRLLWSGRFCAWKGFPLLLRALQEIASDTSFELRVIAYGPLEQASKLLAKKLQLDNRITWLGWPPWESTFAHYDWADAFVFTSLRDTSGTGLLEAMAHGCPVIGLDHQGAHDIMSDDASIRIAVTNPRDVARQIAQAVSMLQRDVQLRQRLSTNSYRRAEEFLWSKQHSKMLNIYSSVIASARTHPVLHPSRTKYLCRTSA